MKTRLFILIFLLMGISSYSQTLHYRTVAFSTNSYNTYTSSWSGWSEWEESDMLLTMDLDTDIVTIYSPITQVYYLQKFVTSFYDSDGDFHIIIKFIDQDKDIGTLRLLQRKSGESEVYIEFGNIKFCYRVVTL